MSGGRDLELLELAGGERWILVVLWLLLLLLLLLLGITKVLGAGGEREKTG